MGRPTRLTKAVQHAIVEGVRNGNYAETAVRAAGIAPSTYYNWKARGQEGGRTNARYVEFVEALTRAEAEAEAHAVRVLHDAMTDDPRMAVEYLKRKAPERWSATDNMRVEHGGEVTQRQRIDTSQLSDETLAAIERDLTDA